MNPIELRSAPSPMTLPEFETRAIQGLELRDNGEGKMPTIVGYAAVFGVRSVVIYDFREIVEKGAFKESLARGDDVRALVEHEPGKIIGRRSAKTLVVQEDEKGLRCEINPPDTQVGKDLVTNIKRGDITGMSFGFRTLEDKWETDPENGGGYLRRLIRCDLLDVSPVAFPAYPQTGLAVRSLEKVRSESAASIRAQQDLDLRLRMAQADAA